MPQDQAVLNTTFEVVDSGGIALQPLREWSQRVSDATLIVGNGSPEGRIRAARYSRYIDETDPNNPREFIKMKTDIDNDRLSGWVRLR